MPSSTNNNQKRRSNSISSFSMHEICDLRHLVGATALDPTVVGLIYVHGSWNHTPKASTEGRYDLLESLMPTSDSTPVIGALQVDQNEESYACCLGDDSFSNSHSTADLPIPPDQLPVLAVAVQQAGQPHARVRYITGIAPSQLLWYSVLQRNPNMKQANGTNGSGSNHQHLTQWASIIQSTLNQIMDSIERDKNGKGIITNTSLPKKKRSLPPQTTNEQALRIFVAGDRSSVGKSSVCLGILGNLLKQGYPASQLAYIKPATQCEATQLVQQYCDAKSIACRAVGPLVYYKGFTRAFLAGETESTAALLDQCAQAVDEIARNKKVVLVDGVGFPAVGSICGTDNASVAKACGYPHDNSSNNQRKPPGILVVGGSGVGAAVDSFNLNATYFESKHCPVMGGIFNKLSTVPTDYYSLENCKEAVTAYFDKLQSNHKQAFGFVPQFEEIAGSDAMKHVEEFIKVFGKHVDIPAILEQAQQIQQQQVGGGTVEAMDTTMDPSTTTVDTHTIPMEDCIVTITTTTTKRIGSNNNNNNNNNKRMKHTIGSGTGTPYNPNVPSIHFPKSAANGGNGNNNGTVWKHTPKDNSNNNNKRTLTRDEIERMASRAGAAGTA